MTTARVFETPHTIICIASLTQNKITVVQPRKNSDIIGNHAANNIRKQLNYNIATLWRREWKVEFFSASKSSNMQWCFATTSRNIVIMRFMESNFRIRLQAARYQHTHRKHLFLIAFQFILRNWTYKSITGELPAYLRIYSFITNSVNLRDKAFFRYHHVFWRRPRWLLGTVKRRDVTGRKTGRTDRSRQSSTWFCRR